MQCCLRQRTVLPARMAHPYTLMSTPGVSCDVYAVSTPVHRGSMTRSHAHTRVCARGRSHMRQCRAPARVRTALYKLT
jgi:hypothetical protein